MKNKRIEFEFLPFPNLVMHVLASLPGIESARNPKYEDHWEDWLTTDEKAFLSKELHLSSPRTIVTTATFALLFQWPAYFCNETIESGWTNLLKLAENPSLKSLLREYPEQQEVISNDYVSRTHNFLLKRLPYNKKACKKLLPKYTEILQNLWDRSYREIWSKAKEEMQATVAEIDNRYFQQGDFIEGWEQVTGLTFPYASFKVVGLDSVNYLGTSLLAERGCFSLWVPEESVFRMIVHEIGTHTAVQTRTLASKEWRAFVLMGLNGLFRLIEAYCALKTNEVCSRVGQDAGKDFISSNLSREREALKQQLKASPDLNTMKLISKAYRELYTGRFYQMKKSIFGLIAGILL